MGLKLEFLLVVLIALTSVITMSIKLNNQNVPGDIITKELEFTDTVFTEVTTHKKEGIAHIAHGTRIGGILSVEDLYYHSDTMQAFMAERGRFEDHRIYVDGNVSLYQKVGFDYHTEHAYYDKLSQTVYLTSSFTAYMDKNIIHGKTLIYDTVNKEANATELDAVVYTAEK